jgi:hypothetical protein
MKCLLTALLLTLGLCVGVLAQSPTCPTGMVCISQAAANKAAENARELEATKGKVTALEESLKLKDASIADISSTAAKNESDLKAAISRTEVELAKVTGQVIQLEADRVRWTAVIDVLVKGQKKQCKPFSVCIF